jgi:hypothetical protein
LYPGDYLLSPWISDAAYQENIDWAKYCATLSVYPAPGPYGDLKLNPADGKYWIPSSWCRAAAGTRSAIAAGTRVTAGQEVRSV